MTRILSKRARITTTGVAGSASGSAQIAGLEGELIDIYVNYHASAPATTVLTITQSDPVEGAILACPASKTDKLFAPRKQACDGAGSLVSSYEKFILNGTMTLAVTLSDALTYAVEVTVRYLG
jgi:hypothetical protein